MSEIDPVCQALANWLRWQRKPCSRLEMAKGLGIARTTLDHHFAHMQAAGYVAPSPVRARGSSAVRWVPGPVQPPAEWRCPLHKQIMPVTSVRFFTEPEDGQMRAVAGYRCLHQGCPAEVTEEHGDKAADVPLDGGVIRITHALDRR